MLKAADVDKYLNKSDLLTLLVFIFSAEWVPTGTIFIQYSFATEIW